MKNLILLFSSILTIGLFQNTTIAQESKKLLIGVNFSPDISYRTLDGSSDIAISLIKSRDSQEKPDFGFTTGINFQYHISSLIGLELGAQYSTKRYVNKNNEQFIVGVLGDPSIPTKVEYFYRYNYIDVPVRVLFKIGKSKFKFIPSAGLAMNFFLDTSSKFEAKMPDGSTTTKKFDHGTTFNSMNLSSLISVGINYEINEKFDLSIEPTLRAGILPIADAPVKERFWNAGLNLSFYYRLK